MNNRVRHIIQRLDYTLLGLFLILLFLGLMTIYSSSYVEQSENSWINTPYGKQLLWIAVSFLLGVSMFFIPINYIKKSSYTMYVIVCLMLVFVLFMPSINGARSWFKLGGFSLQPSEFSKLALSMSMAYYLSEINVEIKQFKSQMRCLVLIGIPSILILLQPDAGTLLIMASFIFVAYREGLSVRLLVNIFWILMLSVLSIFFKAGEKTMQINIWNIEANYVFVGLILSLGLMGLFIVKKTIYPRYRKAKYRYILRAMFCSIGLILMMNWAYDNVFKQRHRSRFQVMFGIKEDRLGSGYNIYQALSAIGSAGAFGKGYCQSTLSNNRYKHVPEQSTDFIFCSWAEERGFFGCLVLLMLYVFFLIRILIIAERQKDRYVRIYAYGVMGVLFFHFLINIAMVIGLAPVIGIPLPFFSKGGSSILTFSMMIFLLLYFDSQRFVK